MTREIDDAVLGADLAALAALTTTPYGRALLELANAGAGRTALGLGTAATLAAADLLARANHTGTQAISTVTGLQTALDAKASTTVTIPADVTTDHTLTLAAAGTSLGVDSATAKNVTVPPNSSVAFAVGTVIEVRQVGAGQVTIVAGAGVTLRSAGGALKLRAQYSAASLLKVATDTWSVQGDLTT